MVVVTTTSSKSLLLLLSCIVWSSESFGIIHHHHYTLLDHCSSPWLLRHHHHGGNRCRPASRLTQQGGSSNRIRVFSSQMSASTEQQTHPHQLNSTTVAADISSSPPCLPPPPFSPTETSSPCTTIMSSSPRNTPTKRQKVAVIGSGAVGSYYGARLFEAGHDVQFYMRSPHVEACREHGLRVTSVHGAVEIAAHDLQAYSDTRDMSPADWIVVSLKSSSLAAIPALIVSSSLLQPDNSTRILVIMNGLVEDDLIQMMKRATGQVDDSSHSNEPLHCCRALYGGMALICCNRLRPGHVDHSYAGLLSAGVACRSNGSDDNDNGEKDDEDRLAFESLWCSSIKDQEIAWESSLLRGRWKKMLWNLPFNGISVAMGGITVDKIMQDASLRQLSMSIMDETIAAANAEMQQHHKKHGCGRYDPLTSQDKEQMMAFTDKMGVYKTSTMLDLVNRQTMEVEYLFCKPVERAERLGVPVPHLKTILAMIQAYQRFYNLL